MTESGVDSRSGQVPFLDDWGIVNYMSGVDSRSGQVPFRRGRCQLQQRRELIPGRVRYR